jgi:hypothetical protein
VPPFTETQNYVTSILASIGNWLGFDSSGTSGTDAAAGDGGTPGAAGGIGITLPLVFVGGCVLLLALRRFV